MTLKKINENSSRARFTLSVEYDNFSPQQSLSEKLTVLRSVVLDKAPPEATVVLLIKAVEMNFTIHISMQIGDDVFEKESRFDFENLNELTRYWLIRVGNEIMLNLLQESETLKLKAVA